MHHYLKTNGDIYPDQSLIDLIDWRGVVIKCLFSDQRV